MKRLLFLLSCVIFTGSVVLGGKGPSNPPPPAPCPDKAKANVTLFFGNCNYPGRLQGFPCGIVPRAQCDPATFAGSTTDVSKWRLRIVIDGDVASSCNTYHMEFNPTTSSNSYTWQVDVPKDKAYKATVEFYENYNSCGPVAGRPKFSWTSGSLMSGTYIGAMLKYEGTF